VLDDWAGQLERRLVTAPLPDPGVGRWAVSAMRQHPRACDTPVLLHGDLNPTNVLSASREPWLAIDPKPMAGDPAYDGVRLLTQPDPLRTAQPRTTIERRVGIVADRLDVAPGDLMAWCLVGAVEMRTFALANGEDAAAEVQAQHIELLRPLVP
jgi:streptomycin 6-kinase